MFSIIQNFSQLLGVPLTFLPASVQALFWFIRAWFVLFLSGKLLKWLWDLLPAV